MDAPKSPAEALAQGWEKAAPEHMAMMQNELAAVAANQVQRGYLCYNGPCSNGVRTICYYTEEGGCNDCYTSSEGC